MSSMPKLPSRGGAQKTLTSTPQKPPAYTLTQFAGDVWYCVKRLSYSTGKAAWISATAFLVLGMPLIISFDREQMIMEQEQTRDKVLMGGPPAKK